MQRFVHLDLKGAPPLFTYFEKIFPLFSKWGATGLLIEYEDMFPYKGDLTLLKRTYAYSSKEIQDIISLATKCNLKVIPLVQTIGHLEFALKHKQLMPLREEGLYPNALCPQHPQSLLLVLSMIDQVMELHPTSSLLHIGADEVWHLGKCKVCTGVLKENSWAPIDLYLDWVSTVCKKVKKKYPNLGLIFWDDMMRLTPVSKLKQYDIGSYAEPMLWKYDADSFDFPDGMFDRFAEVFTSIWVASSYKGATGSTQFLPPIQHYINNHITWLSTIEKRASKFTEIKGIALTGWQRYDHYSVLCELLPVALPSLALCLTTLTQKAFTEDVHLEVSKDLGFQCRINVHPFPRPQVVEEGMSFPGHDIYTIVQLWSNLVCRYQTLCNSEGMLGWFSDYFRSKNFTNPAQVENILYPMVELHEILTKLKKDLETKLLAYFYPETVDEWIGCFLKPLLQRINTVIEDCTEQLTIAKENLQLSLCENLSQPTKDIEMME